MPVNQGICGITENFIIKSLTMLLERSAISTSPARKKAASKSIPGLVDMLGDITLIAIALLAQEKLRW